MVGLWCYIPNQSGVRDPYYGRMCFKSAKTLLAVKRASAISTAKSVELRGLYPIHPMLTDVKNM